VNAQVYLEAALRHWQALRESPSSAATATVLAGLGHLAIDRDDAAVAAGFFDDLLIYAEPPGDQYVLRLALEGFAHLAAQLGQAAASLRLASAATRLVPGADRRRSSRANPILERWIAPARAAAGPRTAVTAWNVGAALSSAEAMEAARAVSDAAAGATCATSPLDLTSRERDVVALVAAGLTNRQIAERLIVGNRTVESHVRSALGKLGFRSRFQLAEWAEEHGLTPST
jgi:non-specific serine/threonine protein kinase